MTDYMNVNNLTDLENVARQVLTHIDKLGEYSQAQVAIIGGMAMSKYMGKSRSTVVSYLVDCNIASQQC
jgi:predicted amino acid dehydrogenase